MDEVYALSVWAEDTEFCSVLSLGDIPDPQKTHFVWSFSKVMEFWSSRRKLRKCSNQSPKMYCTVFASENN